MATNRTLIPPRFSDEHSFSGRGRWQFQRVTNDRLGRPEVTTPPIDGAPSVTTVPRG